LPPTLARSSLAGHYGEFREDPLGLFTRALAAHGDYVRVRFFHLPVTVVNDPEGVRAILESNAENYPRDSKSSRVMRKFIGDGILTANGEHWRLQREALAPHLGKHPVEAELTAMKRFLGEAFDRWAVQGEVDVARGGRTVNFRVLTRMLFDFDATWEDAEVFTDAVSFGQEDVMERLLSLVSPPLLLPLERNAKLKSAMASAHGLCGRMLRRPRDGRQRATYLDAVLDAARAAAGTSERERERWARQMMMTLLIVGAENPSNTVGWALAELSRRPALLDACRSEVDAAGEPSTPADLGKLRHLHRVIHEVLRLYPGGWALDRKAVAEDTLGGFRIPKGAVVLVSPYLMHRNPRFWPNPEAFDPDRFLPAQRENLPRYAFFPFGGGPHQCLGPKYGYQFMPLFLGEFLRRFHYAHASDTLPTPQPLFTLRPRGGVRVTLRARA
jgi:cytochrome P450